MEVECGFVDRGYYYYRYCGPLVRGNTVLGWDVEPWSGRER